MEKVVKKKLKHVYSSDMKEAVNDAHEKRKSGHIFTVKGKKYRATGYKVERVRNEIHTTFTLEEFVKNN